MPLHVSVELSLTPCYQRGTLEASDAISATMQVKDDLQARPMKHVVTHQYYDLICFQHQPLLPGQADTDVDMVVDKLMALQMEVWGAHKFSGSVPSHFRRLCRPRRCRTRLLLLKSWSRFSGERPSNWGTCDLSINHTMECVCVCLVITGLVNNDGCYVIHSSHV